MRWAFVHLFSQNTDGRTSIWFMNGATAGTYGSPRSVTPGWTVQAAADVDADGMTEDTDDQGTPGQ